MAVVLCNLTLKNFNKKLYRFSSAVSELKHIFALDFYLQQI